VLYPDPEGFETVRFGGEGDRGDVGDGLGDFATRRNFEGDRDSDRLRERTAEVTSTWWTCVGEGRVKVPPLFEYDIFLLCRQSILREEGYSG
jgi:hypothetical protein